MPNINKNKNVLKRENWKKGHIENIFFYTYLCINLSILGTVTLILTKNSYQIYI